MILDFSQKPLFHGKFYTGPKGEELTLGFFSRDALNAIHEDEKHLSSVDKYKRGKLAYELEGDPQVDLKSEEIARIKDLIGKRFGPSVVFSCWNMLEGKSCAHEKSDKPHKKHK